MNKNALDLICDLAKKNLQRCVTNNEKFAPLGFIVKGGKLANVQGLIFSSDDEQKEAFNLLGTACIAENSHEVVYVIDCNYRRVATEKELDYIKQNWETEKPSTYPDSMRFQSLIVHYVDFMEKDAKKNLDYKVQNGQVIFSEDENLIELSNVDRNNIAVGFVMGFMKKKGLSLDKPNKEVSEAALKEYPNILGEK